MRNTFIRGMFTILLCGAVLATARAVNYTHMIHLYDLSNQKCMNDSIDENSVARILVPVVGGGIFYTCAAASDWKWVPRRCYLNLHKGKKGDHSIYVLFRDMRKELNRGGPQQDPMWAIYGNYCDKKSFLVCACESMIRYLAQFEDSKSKSASIKYVIKNLYGSFAPNDNIGQAPNDKGDQQVKKLMDELHIEISNRDKQDEVKITNLAHQLRFEIQRKALEIREIERRMKANVPGLS